MLGGSVIKERARNILSPSCLKCSNDLSALLNCSSFTNTVISSTSVIFSSFLVLYLSNLKLRRNAPYATFAALPSIKTAAFLIFNLLSSQYILPPIFNSLFSFHSSFLPSPTTITFFSSGKAVEKNSPKLPLKSLNCFILSMTCFPCKTPPSFTVSLSSNKPITIVLKSGEILEIVIFIAGISVANNCKLYIKHSKNISKIFFIYILSTITLKFTMDSLTCKVFYLLLENLLYPPKVMLNV